MSRKQKTVEALPVMTIDAESQIRSDVERLATMANVYWELYGTPLGKKVVNAIGAGTFQVIQRALQEAMAMGAARLLEKPKTGQFDNMPLELLIRSGRDDNGKFNIRLERIKIPIRRHS